MFNKSFHILIITIAFTALMVEAQPDYLNFTFCVPQNCGNGPNISYPFWITQQQESHCGSPAFNITCKNNDPVLTISNDDYIVKDIFYSNNSILLANADVYNENHTCPTPLNNFSIDGTPFSYSDAYADLYFLYDCSYPNPQATYQLNCSSNATHFSFAVFHIELLEKLNYSVKSCRGSVNAPVEAESIENLKRSNYTDILRRGFVLEWNGVNCTSCMRSGGNCGSLNNEFICFCHDQPRVGTCDAGTGLNLRRKVGIALGVAALIFSCILCCGCIRKSSTRSLYYGKRETSIDRNVEDFIRQHCSSYPKRYSYSDIKKITNSFKDVLGRGGYGSVYKGMLPDGHLVAVKILHASKGNGEEFINEVASIGRTSHVNVVTLLGFCYNGKKRALVFEYMSNGSLDKFINNRDRHLSGEMLYEISLGIARGLEYLHRGCNTRILHFDIKPHNILLNDDFCPKIADFGLAKRYHGKDSIVSMAETRGTIGYIAPEVFSRNFGRVSHKSNVYSYGMLLIEMVGGKNNCDSAGDVNNSSEIYFPNWIYKRLELNEELGVEGVMLVEESEIARRMLIVGLWCIQTDPVHRPPMNKVIDMLLGSFEALQIPPKPFLSSPPRCPPLLYSSTSGGTSDQCYE